MAIKKNISNRIMTVGICAIIGLFLFTGVSCDSFHTVETPTPTPDATDAGDLEEEEDSFDPNEIVIREDPVIMTVDLLPVKYSEFCYFYYISAQEVLSNAESPENVIANGIDGVSFKTVIVDMAKEYAAQYVLYREAYENENYVTNEMYQMYLQSNFMMASDKEELDEMNAELLYQCGVVRNEYISILVYNDAISSYRDVLEERANYSDDELKTFYDAHKDVFAESEGTFEEIKQIISDYKAVYDYDNAVIQKIRNGEVEVMIEESVVESLELPLFVEEWTENTKS